MFPLSLTTLQHIAQVMVLGDMFLLILIVLKTISSFLSKIASIVIVTFFIVFLVYLCAMLIETPLGTKFIEYAEELWANLKKSKGEL